MNQYYRFVCAHSILFHSTFRQEWVLLSQPPQKSCLCDLEQTKTSPLRSQTAFQILRIYLSVILT